MTIDNVVLAGNIRKSVLLELPKIIHHCQRERRDDEAIPLASRKIATPRLSEVRNDKFLVVLELSSWQLEGLAKHAKSPHIATITNIMPDHLNRYAGMTEYIAAKKNIFKFQTKNDFLFLNAENKLVKNFAKEAKSKIRFFRANEAKKFKTNLLGNHNLSNIAAAIKIAKHFKVGDNIIKKTLKNFNGLEGRIQKIAEINGVKYINDTTATTPDATIAAIESLADSKKSKNSKLILIAGGADKNLDFSALAKLIAQKVNFLVLLEGAATERLEKKILEYTNCRPETKPKNLISSRKRMNKRFFTPLDSVPNDKLFIKRANNMEKAVQLAASRAKKGDIILLSPACASFGMFRHEFERGEKFKHAIFILKSSLHAKNFGRKSRRAVR